MLVLIWFCSGRDYDIAARKYLFIDLDACATHEPRAARCYDARLCEFFFAAPRGTGSVKDA